MTESNLIVGEEEHQEKGEHEKITDKDLPLCFMEERHLGPIEGIEEISPGWRMKERVDMHLHNPKDKFILISTDGTGQYLNLHGIVLDNARNNVQGLDPLTLTATKAVEKIGAALQNQYERWQPRARYKQSLDPTSDEVKRLCLSLRRNAKEERVLFHYNGHGVPKPTTNGEIWVFNRTYTQYIPLSVYDLQTWMGAPSIYVYDCSNAGIIIESFESFALQHEKEHKLQTANSTSAGLSSADSNASASTTAGGATGSGGAASATTSSSSSVPAQPPPSYRNCIQLAACGAKQSLPMNPDLPADLFTACLTTPIKVAVRWFVSQSTSKLVPKVTMDLVEKIPGSISDRRTMMGELNWIFTAITDTIAWNTIPKELFHKLFRQDLLVASLFRNFLLAERIMKSCDCSPVSSPALPPTSHHYMWHAWDLVLDLALGQLPNIVHKNEPYRHLAFFEEQLTSFEVWLELGNVGDRKPPEQLPIVLQVLLSQVHRMRALELLGRFLDLGPWAVDLGLSVGIFPYVLKLLQSCAKELRVLMVFIWSKILAVDNTCQADLVRDGGHKYFLAVLQDPTVPSDTRAQAAFILSRVVQNYTEGKEFCLKGSLVSTCLEQLTDPNPMLRQWVAMCLGKLWDHFERARWMGVRDIAHEKLYTLLSDPYPEVRAAAVFALSTFINSVNERSEHANNIDHAVAMTLIKTVGNDASPLVRKELIHALQWLVLAFEHVFVTVAMNKNQQAMSQSQDGSTSIGISGTSGGGGGGNQSTPWKSGQQRGSRDETDRMKRVSSSSSINNLGQPASGRTSLSHTGSLGTLPGLSYGSIYMKIWSSLCTFETDPHPEVAEMSSTITKHIEALVQEKTEQLESRTNTSSLSLPPSPNRGINYLSSESPPTLHPGPEQVTPRQFRTLGPHHRSGGSNRSSRTPQYHHHHYPSAINEEQCDDRIKIRKPLVHTKYFDWARKKFAMPFRDVTSNLDDVESKVFYEKDWRYARNNRVRKEAQEERGRISTAKLDCQVFNTRTPLPPSVLSFHPFDQQIAIAGRDHLGIWDWGTCAKTTVCHNKSVKFQTSKITAMEWVNAHDVAMLMVASDDGSIRVWKPITGQREPTLVGAWQGLPDLKTKPDTVVLSWEQFTQTAIIAGGTKCMKFWDVERELHAFDIPVGCDSPITCIDSTFSGLSHEDYNQVHLLNDIKDVYGINMDGDGVVKSYRYGMVVLGFQDGSIRVYDRRSSPSDARIATFMEHKGTVLNVHLLDNTFYSGSSDGHVKVYDIRNQKVIHSTLTIQHNMTCFAMHPTTGTYACGSLNQNVSIYGFNGNPINTIKFYEGFMGHRIGPVTCLNYHPLRVALATGTSDCSVSVYCLEGARGGGAGIGSYSR